MCFEADVLFGVLQESKGAREILENREKRRAIAHTLGMTLQTFDKKLDALCQEKKKECVHQHTIPVSG